MRYNICGYSQEILLNYNLDCNDATLLRTFMDIYTSSSEKLEYITIELNLPAYLRYSSEQLQLLGSPSYNKKKNW